MLLHAFIRFYVTRILQKKISSSQENIKKSANFDQRISLNFIFYFRSSHTVLYYLFVTERHGREVN